MSSTTFADKPTFVGERVILRPVNEDDGTGLVEVDVETLRLTGSHGTNTLDELRAWYRTRAGHSDRIDPSIVERSTGRWLGEVVLNELDAANQACGFRILIARTRDYGRGFGSEATSLALTHAFDSVGLNRVELEVYAFNPRARHVYEKTGFVREGTKREALCWDGQWVDADLMAMLASDWQKRHPAR